MTINSLNFAFHWLFVALTMHYIIVICAVHKLSNTSSFFYIFKYSAICDVLSCFALAWINLFRSTLFSPIYLYTSHIAAALECTCVTISLLFNGMMSINRYHSTYISYSIYWKVNKLWKFVLAIISIGLIVNFPFYMDDRDFELINGTTWNITRYPWNTSYINWTLNVFIAVVQSIGVVATVMTLYRLHVHKIVFGPERNLIYITIVHIIIYLILLYAYLSEIFNPTGISMFQRNFSVVLEFLSISMNSVTVVLINWSVRQEYKDILFMCLPNRTRPGLVTVVSSTHNQFRTMTKVG